MTNNIRNNRHDRRATENARAITRAKAKKQNIIIATVAVALVAVIAAGVLTIGALNAKPAIAQNTSSVSMKADKAVQPAQKTTANALPTAAQSYNDNNDSSSYVQAAYVQTVQDDSQSTDTQTPEDRIDNIGGERVYIDTKRTAPEATGTPLHYYANGKTSYGFDWDYDADNGNFVLSCNYNFDQQQYDFTFYGVTPGTANVTLYYFTDDNVKVPVNMTICVDNDLNVTMG